MATIKSHTDLLQSKALVEILSFESADMCYLNDGTAVKVDANSYNVAVQLWGKYYVEVTPCWSLAALLNIIPKHIKEYNTLRIDIGEKDFSIWYDEIGYGVNTELPDITMESTVDACVGMIIKLHELNLL